MNDKPPQDHDSSRIVESSAATNPEPDFTKVHLKGVGGWLLLFVIGQLALRPMLFLSKLGNGASAAEIAERFPATATLITIETAIQIALLVGGILVGCLLLKTGVSWPVLSTKVFLVANAVLHWTLAVLYFSSDLPDAARTRLIIEGIGSAVMLSIVSFIWFVYFTKSKRVQATYFAQH